MEVDLIILGGGCAGLSLALELARSNDPIPNTIILESRIFYLNDRTWGYWSNRADRFGSLVDTRFQKMRLRINGDRKKQFIDCSQNPYAILPSNHFYEYALAEIERHPKLELMLGSAVLCDPVKKDSRWAVQTATTTYYAKNIVDSRPSPQTLTSAGGLWQSFSGMEIECDQETFNPECVDLMDFANHADFPVFFTYVIPTSKHRALIEVTVFGPLALQRTDLENDLKSEIQKRVGNTRYSVLREESGVLPMGIRPTPKSADSSYARVGLHAGAARPSTGYAFQRIQHWAALCASQITSKGVPIEHPVDPWLTRMMDAVFISVLRNHPKQAPELFFELFKKVSPRRLIRFLSGSATWLDCAFVIFALPAPLFLSELPRVFRIPRD